MNENKKKRTAMTPVAVNSTIKKVSRKPNNWQELDALFESNEPVGQCSVEGIRALYETMLNDNKLLKLNNLINAKGGAYSIHDEIRKEYNFFNLVVRLTKDYEQRALASGKPVDPKIFVEAIAKRGECMTLEDVELCLQLGRGDLSSPKVRGLLPYLCLVLAINEQ